MLILKSREFLLSESSGIDASIETALVLPTTATAWAHGGWESWSLVPLKQRATMSLLYQPLPPAHQEGWVKGRESAPWGTVHLACCHPHRQAAGTRDSSGRRSLRLPRCPTSDIWFLIQANLELMVSYFHVMFALCDVHSVFFILCIYFYSRLQLK